MTCREWQYLLATAEARELEGNVALQAHLASCPQCGQFARELQALSRAMRSMPHLSPTSEFGARVRQRIEDDTVEASMPRPLERVADRWSEPGVLVQPQAAAVMLLALLALLLMYLHPIF